MNIMTDKLKLNAVRAEMGLEQKELAVEARVTQPTISKMENNIAVSEQTVLKVFFAINRLRAKRGFRELGFDEIAWRLTSSS